MLSISRGIRLLRLDEERRLVREYLFGVAVD